MTGTGPRSGPAEEEGRDTRAPGPAGRDPADRSDAEPRYPGATYSGASHAAPGHTRPTYSAAGHPAPPRPAGPGRDTDVDPDGTRPTDALPRRPAPAAEQATTALPRRRPSGPGPYPTNLPGASRPEYGGAATPRNRTPPPSSGYSTPGYSNPSHGSPGYSSPGYSAAGYSTPGYSTPGYSTPGYEQTGYDPAFPYDDDVAPHDRSYAGPSRTESPTEYAPPAPTPRGAHLPAYREPLTAAIPPPALPGGPRTPRKITVTRVAAMRSRELTLRGVDMFHRATTADGADRSGLAHLTYAQMANYACDAALAVALANTLFLVKPEEGAGRVLLYLLITVAPFAFIAPLIGPFLDRLQTGRRLALAVSMIGRGLLAVPMIFTFSGGDASWVLYPCALGSLVFSKSFGVLKASLTPRVLPEAITLVATNSRLTVFGLIAGGAAGAVSAGLTWGFGSPGALVFTALLGFGGAYLCLKIPAWVESTEGEVPVHLSESGGASRSGRRSELTVAIRTTLWANSSIRIETGFLAMFIAFVVMKEYAAEAGFYKLMLVGLVGGAAGLGGFVGNALGAKLPLRSPETISLIGVCAVVLTTLLAALMPGLAMAAVVGFVGSTSSSLAKVCLDSAIQRDLPEVSRASAFGKSETALQMAWVFGGVIGLLIGGLLNLGHDTVYTIGFIVVTVLVAVGLVQTWLARSSRSMVPQVALPWRRRRPTGGTPSAGPSPHREANGTYTTRISYGDPASPTVPTTPAPAGPPPRTPRAAGSARSDIQQPGRRRLRSGKRDNEPDS